MKTTISGKKIDIKQGGMELFKVAMQGKIEELGLELNIELAQEKHSIVDNVFDKVANECEKYKVTLNNTQLSTQQLALLVTNVYYSALESLSNEGKVAFVCYIDTSKDKLREFMNKNYNIEDNKVYYKITNKDLLDYIKEKNGVILDKQPVEDISGKMNERIDGLFELIKGITVAGGVSKEQPVPADNTPTSVATTVSLESFTQSAPPPEGTIIQEKPRKKSTLNLGGMIMEAHGGV